MVKLGCNLKILSLNVRGINDFKKRRSVFNWIRKNEADITFLQETFSGEKSENQWKNEWGGKILFTHGSKHSRGAAIILRNNLNIETEEYITEPSGRIQILKTKIDDSPICFINLYAPNEENSQVAFFGNVVNLIHKHKIKNHYEIVIGGDFNTVLDANLDKKGGTEKIKEKSRAKVLRLMETLDLIDIWRIKNPGKKRFTWRQRNPLVQCRLDYFLVSETIQDFTSDVDILPAFKSDHSGIFIKISGKEEERRGKGYWKFNTSLLDDNQFIENLRAELTEWVKLVDYLDAQQKWEWVKYKIRLFCIQYSKQKAKQTNKEMETLRSKVSEFENELGGDERNMNDYLEAKSRLEELMDEKTKGTILRAKIRWYESGEKSTKYFFNLEKRNHHKKTINKLVVNGNEINDKKEILKEGKKFYENLYKSSIEQKEAS